MSQGLPPPPTRAASGDFAWTAWNNELYKLLSTQGAISWAQVNKAGSSIADLQNKNHNLLTPIQGGNSTERYHLSLAQYNAMSGMPTSYSVGDTLYATATTTLSKFAKPSDKALYTMTSAGVPEWKIPKYGAFHDTTNQTAAANTPTTITLNTTDSSNGVSRGSPTSRIVIDTAGLYSIQFSIQFTNSNAAIDSAAIWLRVNGTDVANSNSWGAVPGKHAGTNGQLIMALNFFYTFAANDYFELVWMTVNGTTGIETIAASTGTPAYPTAPGVILTVSDNIQA